MLNRIVGLGVDSELDEETLDRTLCVMGDAAFYVTVAPSADPRLDALLEERGLERGWGWMLFERGRRPIECVETALDVVPVDAGRAEPWSRSSRPRTGCRTPPGP